MELYHVQVRWREKRNKDHFSGWRWVPTLAGALEQAADVPERYAVRILSVRPGRIETVWERAAQRGGGEIGS